MKLLETSAAITKKIESVRKSGQSFQNGVQLAACSIVAHLSKHRDKTLLVGLYDAMPNGSRRKSMIDWFNHFVPGVEATYGKNGLTVNLADLQSNDWTTLVDGVDAIVESMVETPWHEYKAETGAQDQSFVALVKYLTRKANGNAADPRIASLVEAATSQLDEDERAKLAA